MEFNLYKVNKRWVVNKIINKQAYCLGSFDDIEIAKKYIEMRIKNGKQIYTSNSNNYDAVSNLDISKER